MFVLAISSLAAMMIIVTVQIIFMMFDLILYMKLDDGIFKSFRELCKAKNYVDK